LTRLSSQLAVSKLATGGAAGADDPEAPAEQRQWGMVSKQHSIMALGQEEAKLKEQQGILIQLLRRKVTAPASTGMATRANPLIEHIHSFS
jgi:hypothetical protein